MLRTHKSFKQVGEKPHQHGFSIVDPGTPERVARVAAKRKDRGLVQLCTTVDAWAPEARKYDLGRRCLEAILAQPGWTVRILTKNAAVARDFDLIERHRDRVLVGISLTALPAASHLIRTVEPYASPIEDRMKAIKEAHKRGLRTYGMLCPLLPGVANRREQISELVQFCLDQGAEEIFAEPVNPRGSGLVQTEDALRRAGHEEEAEAVGSIRKKKELSAYAIRLLRDIQFAVGQRGSMHKLRFLLYQSTLTKIDQVSVQSDMSGVKWLVKPPKKKKTA